MSRKRRNRRKKQSPMRTADAPADGSLPHRLQRLVNTPYFTNAILLAIVASAVLVGLETYPSIRDEYGLLIKRLDTFLLSVFVVEMVLKLGAHAPQIWRFFKDPWNTFDFTIVAVCLLPVQSRWVVVVRLFRVLRALRLVSQVPRLQLLVGALLKSLPSMSYVALLLGLLFYVYAVIGTFLFRDYDPVNFRTLHRTMLTLFEIVTLEGWVDVMNGVIYSNYAEGVAPEDLTPHGPYAQAIGCAYFISFIILGTMIILNLCIGVILNGMEETQVEEEGRKRAQSTKALGHLTLDDELALLEHEVEKVRFHILNLKHRKLRRPGDEFSGDGEPVAEEDDQSPENGQSSAAGLRASQERT